MTPCIRRSTPASRPDRIPRVPSRLADAGRRWPAPYRVGRPLRAGALLVALVALAAPVAGQEPEPDARTAASAAAPEPAPLPRRRVRIPASIDPTGRTDVSAELQRFVDRTKDGTTIEFPEGATFRLASDGIKVSGRRDLAFVGHGTTLRSIGCDYLDSVFVLGGGGEASSRIIIEGFAIEGNNPGPSTVLAHRDLCQHQHGVAIYRSRHVEIRDVAIRRTNGDCVYLSGYGVKRFRWSEDIWFHDSACEDTGRMGVAITAGSDVRVERVRLTGIAIHVFDIEPSLREGGARDVLFADNVVGTYGYSPRYGGWLLAANGNLAARVERVTLRDNVMTDGAIHVLVGAEFQGWDGSRQRRDFRISGNRSLIAAEGPVMDFRHVDGLVVEDNIQALSGGTLVVTTDTFDAVVRP